MAAWCALPGLCHAQNVNVQDAQSTIDYRRRSGAHVDPATLSMQLQIPLGDYPGRAGMRFPVTLFYSSKLWRVEHQDTTPRGGEYDSRFRAETPKESAMGWTSSLDWFLWPSDRKVGPEKYDLSGKLVSGTQYNRTVARMYVTLPDGSKHELRRDDTVLAAGSDSTTGTFHSVDGSRLRYESASRTLFLPDGTRIVSEVDPNGVPVARHVIDRNGNRNTYTYQTGKWADTPGRTYAPPPLRTTAGDYDYFLPGVGGDLRYVFRWRNLSAAGVREPDPGGNVPALRYRGDRSLTYPHTSVSPSLFATHDEQNSLVSNGSLFDPVVLSEIELPDGKKYTFKYNVWGEIVRVDYPMGAYELFTYDAVTPVSSQVEAPLYAQANRGVTKRTLVVPGAENGTSVWTYGTTIDSSVVPLRLMRRVTAPDNSYTETLYHHGRGAAVKFGFEDARAGKPYDERVHSASGRMLRRTLTKWEYTGPVPSDPNSTATRDARATKVVEILLDTDGAALATTTERQYDSDLNVTSTSRHAFVSLARATAESAAVDSITKGAPLRTEETDYLTTDPAYRARNLLSLPTASRVKNAAGDVVAQSQMFYDETALAQYGAVTGWDAPGVSARGNLTKTRGWVDMTDTWVETRAEYDQCGSPVKTVDALGRETLIAYAHAYAYPADVTTPAPNSAAVPNPSGVPASFVPGTFGSTAGFTTHTAYDPDTGRVTSTTDANDRLTTFDYTDPLNRLKRVDHPGGGSTEYFYDRSVNAGVWNDYVRTLTSLDSTRSVESYQFYDGLGRPTRAFLNEGGAPAVFITTDTQYDTTGRVWRVSNPYRTNGWGAGVNPTGLWTATEYDALGRVTKVTTPDGARVSTEYAGAHVRVTDQDDRQRVSISDALGLLREVWEVKAAELPAPDPWLEGFTFPAAAAPGVPSVGTGYKTSYAYDALGNLRTVTQGEQPARVFTYDSLSRLKSASNPESGTVNYGYDENGNLTGKTDARGITTTYVYDRLNRNVITHYAGGGTTTPDVRRFYDGVEGGKGRLRRSEAVGVAASEVVSYDAAGRPTEQRQSFWVNDGWGQEYSVHRTYDKAGNVLTQTYPSGHTVSYNYDAAGRPGDNGSQLAFTGNLGDGVARTYASAVTYDEFGGLREERFGTQTPLYHKLHYNVRGQLYDVRLSTASWAADPWEWNRGALVNYYDRDCQWKASDVRNNGNLRCGEHAVPLDPNASYTPGAAGAYATSFQTYTYDALNRLKGVTEKKYKTGETLTPAFTQAYKYDRWGNRTIDAGSTQVYGQNPDYSIPEPQFGVDPLTNRLGVPAGQPGQMIYDPAGNLTTDTYQGGEGGGGTRAYDAEGRMTSAQFLAGQTQTASYTYDADGRRVKRKAGVAAEVWQIYGSGGELLAEYAAGASHLHPLKEYGYRGGELLVTAEGGTPRTNVALASAGATATALRYTPDGAYPGLNFWPSYVNDGRRYVSPQGDRYWRDGVGLPTWVQVDFAGAKTIGEVDVYTLADYPAYETQSDPTPSQTFTQYGVTSFEVQYWTGSEWAAVPGGSVSGNNLLWRKVTFPALTTNKIRVRVTSAADGVARVTEVEAWEAERANFALASRGAQASASSTTPDAELPGMTFPVTGVIDGDRKGVSWEDGGGWRDGTNNSYPDWAQVEFAGERTIDEIDVFTLQDATSNPSEPSEAMTFTQYGVTSFDVEYWTGSAWATVPGGSVSGNDKVWRKFTFPAVTTTKVRVLIHNALAGRSRLVEVEAWGASAAGAADDVRWLVSDHLGTPRMIVDKTGSLAGVTRHDYLPFGEELFADMGGRTKTQGYGGVVSVRQKFIGTERDGETDLDYMRARYFSSTQGRFIGADPLQTSGRLNLPQSLNRYTYALNNPLRMIDPTGLSPQDQQGVPACDGSNRAPCIPADQFEDAIPLEPQSTQYVVLEPATEPAANLGTTLVIPLAIGTSKVSLTAPFIAGAGLLLTWELGNAIANPRIPSARNRDGSISCTAGNQAYPPKLNLPPTLPAPPMGDPNTYAKTPGQPAPDDGFTPKKKWDGKLVPAPNGRGYGYPDDRGNVWVPTGEGPLAHGGPHWDVQHPDGSHTNVYPGGRNR